ncbi:epsilon-toxin type B, partial [Clostridium botulinum C/D]|nr:epsilon-toxin type B [Clostridium botulinum C/D]
KLARMANSSDFVPVANSDTEMTIMGIGEYSTDTATNFMLNIEQLDLNGDKLIKSNSYVIKPIIKVIDEKVITE